MTLKQNKTKNQFMEFNNNWFYPPSTDKFNSESKERKLLSNPVNQNSNTGLSASFAANKRIQSKFENKRASNVDQNNKNSLSRGLQCIKDTSGNSFSEDINAVVIQSFLTPGKEAPSLLDKNQDISMLKGNILTSMTASNISIPNAK